MIGLIFWIIIIWIVWKSVKKKRSEGQSGYGQDLNQTKKAGGALRGISEYKETLRRAGAKGFHSITGTAQTKTTETQTGTTEMQTGTTEEISTTEYLRQKALEDEKEHAEEAMREARRLNRETGGRPAAQRHYDGDNIPRGMRLVKCSYCGAENLIAGHHNQKDYTCYFCREIL